MTDTHEPVTDVVLAAVRAHHRAIATDAQTATSSVDENPFEDQTVRRRRDAGEPQTQITLLLIDKNREVLDRLAREAGYSRSAYVDEALRRAL
jgi:hypothetical protein